MLSRHRRHSSDSLSKHAPSMTAAVSKVDVRSSRAFPESLPRQQIEAGDTHRRVSHRISQDVHRQEVINSLRMLRRVVHSPASSKAVRAASNHARDRRLLEKARRRSENLSETTASAPSRESGKATFGMNTSNTAAHEQSHRARPPQRRRRRANRRLLISKMRSDVGGTKE